MRRLNVRGWLLSLVLLSAVFGVAVPSARAQFTAKAVSACGAESFVAGNYYYIEITTAGNVCTNSSGGGGGGAITSTVLPTGAANNPTTQVTVTTTSTTLIAARTARAILTIQNGATPEFIGPCPVTTSSGLPLAANASATYPSAAQWCGITASGSSVNGTVEIY